MTDLLWYAVPILVMYVSFRVLKWNNRQQAAKRAPERMAAAAARGWSYEQEQTLLFEIGRWRGSTSGIDWVAETARSGTQRSRLDGAAQGSATLVTRWYTQQRMPVSGPVLLMQGNDGEGETNEVATVLDEIDSPLARKMIGKVLDVGLSVKFGEPVGAAVEGASLLPGILPATGYDGYNLMAADPADVSTPLFERVGPALAAARAAAGGGSLSVLITPAGLAISVPKWTYQADELAPIVDAGVALTTALR
jgi:hypothetical protein